ncbi:hypothetical protein LguiA_007360 [Lonicera macranthoides]
MIFSLHLMAFPLQMIEHCSCSPSLQFINSTSFLVILFAGLVFVPLTRPYLCEYGKDWYNTSPHELCEQAFRDLPRKADEQLVILSQKIKLLNSGKINPQLRRTTQN